MISLLNLFAGLWVGFMFGVLVGVFGVIDAYNGSTVRFSFKTAILRLIRKNNEETNKK